MIEYTKEGQDRFALNDINFPKLQAAIDRGDEEAEFELRKLIIMPAETLLSAMISRGADWIRERGWNTSEAERVFGKDWMERDIAKLQEINFARHETPQS